MAEENQQPAEGKKTKKSKKLMTIGIVVLAQLVVAYFLVGFVLKRGADPQAAPATAAAPAKTAQTADGRTDPNFDHVFVVKDMIVNPAGTNGLRFLLTTIGLEVTSEATMQELQKRTVQIHDAIINILTSKTLPELDDINSRDSLKVEIKQKLNKDLTTGSVLNVYFSKFIIQ
ncbi:MAG: flagellar basal body-associated FliL family protein [Bacteroidetes bacterium]|jgi:flagellar FliL protein|nr:flagellar basal body-associated FliL family protein [Bacteroidota bacterium]